MTVMSSKGYRKDNSTDVDVNYEITHKAVTAISKLKHRKSPGVDGIPAELITAGGYNLVDAIHKLCI